MKKSILVALMSVVLISCGGDPLSIWKVSSTKNPKTCTDDKNTPPNTDTGFDQLTWEIYKGKGADDKDNYYLWTGGYISGALEGTEEKGTYTFKREKKENHETWGENRQASTTTKDTITFEIKGNSLKGTWEWEEVKTCSTNATGCAASDRGTCTTKQDIYGVKVDPDFTHEL